jgi:ribosomal-protein-alanine N-acetyltransferase
MIPGGAEAEEAGRVPEGGSLHIRPATPGDLDRILEVDAACFTRPWSEVSFRSLIAADHVVFLVAEINVEGRGVTLAGHGTLMKLTDEAELTTLAVDPAFRGRGIGSELLDRLLEAAVEARVRTVFLEVRASNEVAISLYRTRGFRHVGVRRQYYDRPPEDALVLRLRLPTGLLPEEGT